MDRQAFLLEAARALRSGDWRSLDATALAEEIESMAGSDRRELESRVVQILEHLLKLRHSKGPLLDYNRRGWEASIIRQQEAVERELDESPSLDRLLTSELLAKCYRAAARIVAKELEVNPEPRCPWDWRHIRGRDD